MSYFGNLSNFDYKTCEWAIFIGRLNQFLKVNEVKEEKKAAILLTHLSDDSYRLLRNLAYPRDLEELSFKELVALLNSHFKPKHCTYADKAKFFNARKDPCENMAEWAARLRGLASFCNFGTALEQNLTDRFVLGLGSGPVRDKLFEQDASSLTLTQALEVAEKVESAREARTTTNEELRPIKEEPIYRHYASDPGQTRRCQRDAPSTSTSSGGSGWSRDRQRAAPACSVCGMKNHVQEKCRFKSYHCQKCGKKGHLRKVCKNKSVDINNIKDHELKTEDQHPSCEECQNFNLRYVSDKPIKLPLMLNSTHLSMELDSGSAKSVISDKLYYKKFSNHKLNDCAIKMCLYDGHKITPMGYFYVNAIYNNIKKMIKIFVIKNGGPPLLGRDFMSSFNLILTPRINNISLETELNELLEQNSELWQDELGCFNKFEVHLELKENTTPKFFKARSVPFALKKKVESELERLVSCGVLKPVNHSEYATPIVPVLKENGKIRIAGDYSVTLNKDLVIDKYPLPRIEEVFAKLGGGEHYSKIDLKNAYSQFRLSEKSQLLTTINTTKGLFKYTRLVYGLANAPAIFQKSMENLLSGIDGVSIWLDDLCITAPSRSLHLDRLRQVLNRLNEAGLRLQKEKCDFFKDSVIYLGYVINKNGLQTSPEKVTAILNAPEPSNTRELKRFLGVVNYYRCFIPNASSIMNPLHNLLKTGVSWHWGPSQRRAMCEVRRQLASDRVLAHFDPDTQLVLSVDAGPGGLGAVLAHKTRDGRERPLAFASRSLSVSERNYSQIHKEAAAIIFGVKKFHQYLYGLSEPFILKTDHKPLITIFNKKSGISTTTALRLQRYAIILSAYNYIVQYTSSSDNIVADYFSRAPIKQSTCLSDKEYDAYYSLKFVDGVKPAIMLKEITVASSEDKILKTVLRYMNKGWPRKIKCKSVRPYYLCKTDLQWVNGVLLRGHKVVIPLALRERMLDELHDTHLGIIKTKSNARSRMWWPGIDRDIERRIGACDACTALRRAPPREPPAPWPRAPQPWHRIHIDYMSISQRTYLVVVDSFTKWIECVYMQNGTSTAALINKLKIIFSIFGLPNVIVSDNDAKINSLEFRQFCSNNGIDYVNSPIYHPPSNGQAEIGVRTCKKMLKCILGTNGTQSLVHDKLLSYLFTYRNTIHCTTGDSPAKLMFGRNLRSRLDLILPSPKTENNESNEIKLRRQFKVDDKVMVRWYSAKGISWVFGRVRERIGNVMYKVYVPNKHVTCIRHINQLIKFKGNNNIAPSNNDYDISDIDLSVKSPSETPPLSGAQAHSGLEEECAIEPDQHIVLDQPLVQEQSSVAQSAADPESKSHEEAPETRPSKSPESNPNSAQKIVSPENPVIQVSHDTGERSKRPKRYVDYKIYY